LSKITSVNLSDEVFDALKGTSNRSEIIDEILRENIHRIGMHTIEDRNELLREKFEEKLKKEAKGLVVRCMKEAIDEVMEDV